MTTIWRLRKRHGHSNTAKELAAAPSDFEIRLAQLEELLAATDLPQSARVEIERDIYRLTQKNKKKK